MHGIYVHANVDDLDLWCNHFDNQASNNTTVGLFFHNQDRPQKWALGFCFQTFEKTNWVPWVFCLFIFLIFLSTSSSVLLEQGCVELDYCLLFFFLLSFNFFFLLFYLFCLISVIIALIFCKKKIFQFFKIMLEQGYMRITQVFEGFFYLEFI